MVYNGSFKIKKSDYDYYKKLLSIDDLENSDIGKQDDYIYIATINFENGNSVCIDLASGNTNYYDNIYLVDENGNELSVSDCNFEINNFSLFYEEDIYDIKMIIESENKENERN